VEPSYVLLAMGLPLEWSMGAVRATLGGGNSDQDIDYVLDVLPSVVQRIRSLSPAGVS
jgi:cysteine desulfurase